MSRDWWRRHFDDRYFQLHEPLFTEAESRREVAAMMEMLALPTGARLLDLPCGWGRHTALFPLAHVAAVGADLSPELLLRARQRAGALGTIPPLAAAEMRALPFRDACFDAVVNVYTSLGLYLDDEQDRAALGETRRVLRPGGRFLLESMHRDDVIAAYAERDRWRLPDGTEVRVRRRFDPVAGISYERLRWKRGDEEGGKAHALRLRTATEIDRLLREAGFEPLEYYGDWSGEPLRHHSPRVIAVALRGPSLAGPPPAE